MKQIIGLLLIISIVYAQNNYLIEPIGKMQFRFEDRTKEYSPLGEALLNAPKTEYYDYIIGGSLGVRTKFDTISIDTIAYGVGRLHKKSSDPYKNENTFYDNHTDGFLYLGELNIKKEFDKHSIKLGRQTYDTPLVNQNYRITQNSFEGINYNYKDENFEFKSLYFTKIASSSLANNVPFNHKYGFIGYGLGYDTSDFEDLSTHLINQELSTNGAIHFQAKYGEKDSYIAFENLFVDNFFNTSNLTLAYNLHNFYFKLGVLSQISVGKDHMEKHIETVEQGKTLKAHHYHGQIKYQKDNFIAAYSIAYTPYDENSIYSGTFFSPFSNKPSLVVGMNTNHATIADTTSHKIDALYKGLKAAQIPLVLAGGYINYDIGKHNGLSPDPLDTSEWYFHLQGYFSKSLSTTLRYSYSKNIDPIRERTRSTMFYVTYEF